MASRLPTHDPNILNAVIGRAILKLTKPLIKKKIREAISAITLTNLAIADPVSKL